MTNRAITQYVGNIETYTSYSRGICHQSLSTGESKELRIAPVASDTPWELVYFVDGENIIPIGEREPSDAMITMWMDYNLVLATNPWLLVSLMSEGWDGSTWDRED